MEIKKNALVVSLLWSLLVATSFGWDLKQSNKIQKQLALLTARTLAEQAIITRRWNAGHGGVYVPITKNTRPNPYLTVPLRDIKVNDSLTLTMINPAYMTRQISEIANTQNGIQFHITSLSPKRPENAPSEAEKKDLEAFNSSF